LTWATNISGESPAAAVRTDFGCRTRDAKHSADHTERDKSHDSMQRRTGRLEAAETNHNDWLNYWHCRDGHRHRHEHTFTHQQQQQQNNDDNDDDDYADDDAVDAAAADDDDDSTALSIVVHL